MATKKRQTKSQLRSLFARIKQRQRDLRKKYRNTGYGTMEVGAGRPPRQ